MSAPAAQSVIEGFWLKNFRGIKYIALGSSFLQSIVDIGQDLSPYELTHLTTFIGPSGSGKRSILDAFAFLADIMSTGLDEALSTRGGFSAVYNRGGTDPMSFGIVYRSCAAPVPLTYVVNIGPQRGSATKGEIVSEGLIYRDAAGSSQQMQTVLFFQNGEKFARFVAPWKNAAVADIEELKRTDSKHLGLVKLGTHDDVLDVPQLKRHLTGFRRSCFTPDNAFGLSPVSFKADKHTRLLAAFKQFKEKHNVELGGILEVIAQRMHGVEKILFEQSDTGRHLLRFVLSEYPDPFEACQVSEGTLRLFSHMMMVEDPAPSPLLGVEEPAAYMDLAQIKTFCSFVREHAYEMGGTQFFLTTNSMTLVDYMDPTEVWLLTKTDDKMEVIRAYDELNYRGVDLNTIGPCWYTDYIYRGGDETRFK